MALLLVSARVHDITILSLHASCTWYEDLWNLIIKTWVVYYYDDDLAYKLWPYQIPRVCSYNKKETVTEKKSPGTWLIATVSVYIINPRRMRRRVTVVVLCVCLSVCNRASCYIPHLYVENQVSLGFLCWFQRMHCVDFVENALFRSSGDICWPPRPS